MEELKKENYKLLREEVIKCPVCGEEKMKVSIYSYDMPMIGPVIIVTGKCASCGYKFVDIKTLERKGNQRIEFKVENEKDLNTLVLRSSTATLEIPELQAEISPGPISQGFLTTVEGVLHRFKDIIEFLCKDATDEKEKKECEERLKRLGEMLEGKREFTIIIKDPEGYSKIASEKAKEEIKRDDDGIAPLESGDRTARGGVQ
ncbi:hypothetical protein EYM_04910 [Ignicoccus islandicus DSM 13165]|uniref:Zinc finger ZPR1-type domain-containing protein n=1 Tax=Ignicoccus islandicus DSM 13165 TaxID=940295 RepID=A0A0U3FQS5_9CREN|nr:ZPR1 zinc finger domain-containing protein [Ignicoccus islandicus]ALU11808.1 hypothetical protein EYM_04910 [Ignicoccus islandicus DSM 13165]